MHEAETTYSAILNTNVHTTLTKMEHYEQTLIEHNSNNKINLKITNMEINMNLNKIEIDDELLQNAALEAVDGSIELPIIINKENKQVVEEEQASITLMPANAATTTNTTSITDVDININKNEVLVDVEKHAIKEVEEEEEEEEEELEHEERVGIDDNDDDDGSNDSNISNLSGLYLISDTSGREWQPICTRPLRWVHKQMNSGADPRILLSQMVPSVDHFFSDHMSDMTLWRILASILSEPPRRQKLPHINTFDDVVSLIKRSKNIIVLTGAGVSVSCGIPDFRSSDGIYARLAKEYPGLPDPQAMFDINYFYRDPRPFFKFAREIYPGQFRPSPCHRFIKRLEEKEQLLRNYTQNIDTLEQVAGIRNVIECHGSFSTASCTRCKYKCSADDIRADVFAQRIPLCPRCMPNTAHSVHVNEPVPTDFYLRGLVEHGIMKPDIVFFGEGLPDEFHTVMGGDKSKCDLLIVIGSSLKVRPVALIPSSLPPDVPQILINREQLQHLEFDVQLLGDSDVIINQLCHCLGEDFNDICFNQRVLHESALLQSFDGLLPLSRSSLCSSDMTVNSNEEEAITSDDVEEIESEGPEHEEEEEVEEVLDTDSQSVKSSASTDLALRTAGIYSDSGFESSTSSGNTNLVEHLNLQSNHDDVNELNADSPKQQINIKTTPIEHIELKPIVVETTETVNETIIPKQKTQAKDTLETTTTTETNRIDSLTVAQRKTIVKRNKNRRNTSECLVDGTYFCNDKKSAYVFPGAQVHWYTSSEEEEDEEDSNDEDEHNNFKRFTHLDEEADDKMTKKLHSRKTAQLLQRIPLHTLSAALAAAASQKTATPTTTTTNKNEKRHSTDSDLSESSSSTTDKSSCTPPPLKKRCDIVETVSPLLQPKQQQQETEIN